MSCITSRFVGPFLFKVFAPKPLSELRQVRTIVLSKSFNELYILFHPPQYCVNRTLKRRTPLVR